MKKVIIVTRRIANNANYSVFEKTAGHSGLVIHNFERNEFPTLPRI